MEEEIISDYEINCILAICGKNSIGQGSSLGQSIDTNTASNSGNDVSNPLFPTFIKSLKISDI
jgi:hypothetical protein